jgi:hypothetical protein
MSFNLICLQNILKVLLDNGVHSKVSNDGDTILFEGVPLDVPYKDALIDAGATFDSAYGCWAFWPMEE